MEQNTAYRYEAINDHSYNELVAYAINLVANVSLYPSLRTIVIDGKAANDVGKFIDEQGLGFHIAPIELNDDNINGIINAETTDPDTLRKVIYHLLNQNSHMAEQHETVIAEITRKRDAAEKDRDMYRRLYSDSNRKVDRIKGQMQSLAALINSIYPKEE